MGVMLSSISRARVGVPGKTDEIIWQASLCAFVSFLGTYFLLRPPAQDTHAYDMIGHIIAVYIHFIIHDFISQVLPTICLHCINAVVALRAVVPEGRGGQDGQLPPCPFTRGGSTFRLN